MSGEPKEFLTLTPLGWAAVASTRLAERFPGLKRFDPEVQTVLRPLFRKAIDAALEQAYQGLMPTPPTTSATSDQKKDENPT